MMIPLINPNRPPRSWWEDCVRGVKRSKTAYSPEKVCGALWYKKMSPAKRKEATARHEKEQFLSPRLSIRRKNMKRKPPVKAFKLLTPGAKRSAFKRFGKKYRSLKSFSRAMSSKKFYAFGTPVGRIHNPAGAGCSYKHNTRRGAMALRKRRAPAIKAYRRKRRHNIAMDFSGIRKVSRARSRRRRIVGLRFGTHRPVLRYTGKGWFRPKRSRYFHKPTRINRRRRVRHSIMRRNPVYRMNVRRRYHRTNPRAKVFSRNLIMTSAKIGGGIALGAVAMPLVYNIIPAANRTSLNPWLGAINIIIGALGVSFIRNKNVKDMMIVVAGTGVYDLLASNVPSLGLPALPRAVGPMFSKFLPSAVPSAVPAAVPVSSSYPVARLPVSPVARGGMSANYPSSHRAGYGASYAAPGMKQQGLSSDNPYGEIEGWE